MHNIGGLFRRFGFILVLFCSLEGTRTRDKAILKPPSESKHPKGRFQDSTGKNYDTIPGVFFSYLFVFWASWGVSGTGLTKNAEKVRNETLQNLENGVPVYTGAQFSLSPRHPQIVDFEFIYGFIWDLLATLY